MRLHAPGLKKKGGGVRVKQLTLDNNWSAMSGIAGQDASYGKTYDYTIQDLRYGKISSGVASYEPQIGGDENPFHKPAESYQAAGGRLLPSIDFFQEEPFGENFFPTPVVGYSSVKVRSIHISEGKSSQNEEEYLYYTAKDFPIEVNYTSKVAPGQSVAKSLRHTSRKEHVLQGYTLQFNDMHGKPKGSSNYVLTQIAGQTNREKITGEKYNYVTDGSGSLSGKVRALIRTRGQGTYELKDNVQLGREVDFSIDSRSCYFRSFSRKVQLNVNGSFYGIFLVIVPTGFFPDKEEEQLFQTMVSTKIVQQYGIVKSVEHFDHGAITVQENMVFNAESGDILLSRTSNEFEDNTYDLKYPAYFAYPDMGPAYVTAGYEIAGTAFIASPHPYIQVSSNTNLNFGDELLVTYDVNSSTVRRKLWIDSVGASTRIYVAPRFKSSGYGSTQSTTFPDWSTGATVNNIKVKVVRPARHNTLQTLCQSAVLAQNPDEGSINSLFGTAAAYQKILSVSGSRFSDSMGRFTKVLNNKVYQDNLKYLNASSHYLNDLNEFVTGIRGNYRANETYASIYGRDYSKNHIRYDGAFAAHAFWVLVNAQTLLAKNSGLYEYFPGSNAHCTSEYARPSYITNVDVYGNVLEEVNMMSQKVAAQYGYNHQLPVAVAANARHSEFFFENFESYSLLTNGKMRGLWRKTGLLFTPFASVFDTVRPISGFYTNVSGSATNNLNESSYDIIRNMQAYNFMDRRAISANLSDSLMISAETSHTGLFSLKALKARLIPIATQQSDVPSHDMEAAQGSLSDRCINGFAMPINRKCIVDLWVKPIQGSNAHKQVFVSYDGTDHYLSPKTQSIDGWYLVEGVVAASGSNPLVYIGLPANAFIDDVRIVPVDASMKCFVYNPYSFKLVAQLDENHATSFYEYDQEGLLVRTKRETEQGILTITESRRSNAKK